jgi:hypothetical protein
MDKQIPEQESDSPYSLEVLEEAKADTVDRMRHGHNIRTPIEIRQEAEERRVSDEITSRARSGDHFKSSLDPEGRDRDSSVPSE